jgi:hypothetical protein
VTPPSEGPWILPPSPRAAMAARGSERVEARGRPLQPEGDGKIHGPEQGGVTIT